MLQITHIHVPFRLLVLRSGTAYQMMSPPLRPCQPSGAIWRHTYSAAVTTLSDIAVLTLTIVVLLVALLLRTLLKYHLMMMIISWTDWAVDTMGLIITSVTCCGQEAQSVSDTSGGTSGTRSCWWMVDQICADPVWPPTPECVVLRTLLM